MEKFSVLMSVYCKEKPAYFDVSLESILVNQTLHPDEFVLVCDGELTPELEAVIDKYQRQFPDVMKVHRKENGGLGKALNFGLPRCSYPLVARADSDDVCAPQRFEKQVKYMEEHTDVSVISSYIDEFDEDWRKPMQMKTLPLSHDELYEWAKFRNPLNHMAVVMRRDDIVRIGSYHHVPYSEDYELWVRVLINGMKIGNVGEVLVHARTGNGMIKRRGAKSIVGSWRLINREMLDAGMINYVLFVRNMLAIHVFVFMPDGLKNFLYRKILRKNVR